LIGAELSGGQADAAGNRAADGLCASEGPARVEDAGRVQRRLDRLMHGQRRGSELLPQPRSRWECRCPRSLPGRSRASPPACRAGRKADPAELERYFAGVHGFYATLPPARYPVLTAIAPYMTGAAADDRFEFGLNALLAGFEAASAAAATADQQRG